MQDIHLAAESVLLPATDGECRQRIAWLQGEIASIRLQIATTDIRRQTEKKTLDPAWFHRAKTALRSRQRELAEVSAHLGTFGLRRDGFKDALIEVMRAACDDQAWADLVQRARDRHQRQGESHG